MTTQRSRKYNALSWRSECLDTYKWQADGKRYSFSITYHDGNVPAMMMTDAELAARVAKWYQREASGQLFINDIGVERDDNIKQLNIVQLDGLAVLMHNINHRCIDWTIDCDDIQIIVSQTQTINLQVKNFGIPLDSDCQRIFDHILRQLDLFTRG
jgi:hypothetical protein